MGREDDGNAARKWAHLRFIVVGPLLASPPRRGELKAALREQADKKWNHPTTGESVRFGLSTVERWYYAAKNAPRDPVADLRRKVRKDAGEQPSMGSMLRRVLAAQHRDHPAWSAKLHYDNLVALARQDASVGPVPSCATVRRYMRTHDLLRKRPPSRRQTEGTERAARRLERFEVRSYEATHVGALWHSDFHTGSRKVLEPDGRYYTPKLFGVLDDRSRLVAHLQWYLDETAEAYVDGMMQAFSKYDLPRTSLSDNGSAMQAAETINGLHDLSILQEWTLSESPYQNGKQEAFWNQVEGRLLAMLEGVDELTLDLLNEATAAWLHVEYNRKLHEEIGVAPLTRFLQGPSVLRPCPDSETLRLAFRCREERTQRRSDGTVSIEGVRFEVPSRFRQMKKIIVRYARWDLGRVDMVDPHSDVVVARLRPQDKQRNADGRRRHLEPVTAAEPTVRSGEIAPLLRNLMNEYAATGLPPAYLPRNIRPPKNEDER